MVNSCLLYLASVASSACACLRSCARPSTRSTGATSAAPARSCKCTARPARRRSWRRSNAPTSSLPPPTSADSSPRATRSDSPATCCSRDSDRRATQLAQLTITSSGPPPAALLPLLLHLYHHLLLLPCPHRCMSSTSASAAQTES